MTHCIRLCYDRPQGQKLGSENPPAQAAQPSGHTVRSLWSDTVGHKRGLTFTELCGMLVVSQGQPI